MRLLFNLIALAFLSMLGLLLRLTGLSETTSGYIKAAREALAAGNLDEAEKLKEQATKSAALDSLETAAQPATQTASTKAFRPPFPASTSSPFTPATETGTDSEDNPAIKSWYIRKFGEIDAGADQVARELYGASYAQATYYKHADYMHYLRTGESKHGMARTILLTQDQIMDAVANAVPVAAIKATMVEAQDELGGYLVPEDRRLQIIARLPGITVVRQRATVITTSRDKVTMPRQTGGTSRYKGATRVTWVDEQPASDAAATNMTFGDVGIPIHTVMASVTMSQNLLEDNAFNLDSYLTEQFTSDFAINEDEQFLIGNGVGRPQGVLNGSSTGGPNDTSITTVNSGHASKLLADSGDPVTKGVIAVPYSLDAQYRANAIWTFNRAFALAVRGLKDGNGAYLWATKDGQISNGQMTSLVGYGIAESEAMGTITANYYPAILGDWKGYTIADRIGLAIKRYEDFTTGRQNQVGFVARRRLGGQVTEPWRFVVLKIAA